MSLDMLIKNGRVIDTARDYDDVCDIGIRDGRIVPAEGGAPYVVDASGCLVLPGLVDFHAHVFSSGCSFAVPADIGMLPFGVTTVVDAGTCGVADFPAFKSAMALQTVRVKALLNVCSAGLSASTFHENVDPAAWERNKIVRVYRDNKDTFLGLKIRISRDVVGSQGLVPLAETIKLAEEIGDSCRVVVHVTDPPDSLAQVAEMLRPGDIFCHVYHGTGKTIVEDGGVHPAVKEARRRGVLFDAANGNGHFVFEVARAALEDDFPPDVISSDLTTLTMNKTRVVGLPYVMSKYLHLGLDLRTVVKTVTSTPAELIGMGEEIGTLAPGARADVALFKIVDMPVRFEDTRGVRETGDRLLLPQMTVKEGVIMYRSMAFDFGA